ADAASGGETGRPRVGPRGLLGILQTRLALSRPAVDQAVRIAQYLRLVEQCVASPADRERFWPARSFALDPWSTARQLLRWRDAAVEAGWRPDRGGPDLPPRLAALAAVEGRAVVGMLGTTDADGNPATLVPGAGARRRRRGPRRGPRWKGPPWGGCSARPTPTGTPGPSARARRTTSPRWSPPPGTRAPTGRWGSSASWRPRIPPPSPGCGRG